MDVVPFEELAEDILYWIFFYLDAPSFVSLSSTCVSLNEFSKKREVDSVWKEIYKRKFHSHLCETFPHFSNPQNNQQLTTTTTTWKSMYQAHHHTQHTITTLNTLLTNTRPLHSTSFRSFQFSFPDCYGRENFVPPLASRSFSHFLFQELSTRLEHPFPASDLYICTKFEMEKWMNISFKMRTRDVEFCKKVYDIFIEGRMEEGMGKGGGGGRGGRGRGRGSGRAGGGGERGRGREGGRGRGEGRGRAGGGEGSGRGRGGGGGGGSGRGGGGRGGGRGGGMGLVPPLFLTTCNSAGSCSFCPAFVVVVDCMVNFCVIIDRD